MSIVLMGSTSGSITLSEPAVAGSNTISLPAVTGTVVVAGQNSAITAGTAVASTSGTSIDFTSIPSWVKRITVMFQGVSTNGTSSRILRLGTSSGIVTTGYASGGAYTGPTSSGTARTNGLSLDGGTDANATSHGHAIITNITGDTWVHSCVFGQSDNGYVNLGGGSISLSAALTQIRITTVNGTDTFDAGTINILYE